MQSTVDSSGESTASNPPQANKVADQSNQSSNNPAPTISPATTTDNQNNLTSNAPASETSPATGQTAPQPSNTFLPLTRAKKRENIDQQEVYDINKIDRLRGTESAARKARFSPFKVCETEYSALHNLLHNKPEVCGFYLYIRSRIVEKWFDNVHVELLREDAYEFLEQDKLEGCSEELKKDIFNRTFDFLDRTGRINFGIFERKQEPSGPLRLDRTKRAPLMPNHLYKPPLKSGGTKAGRVIVIGAGLSGLIAARQLQRFGMEVIVVEPRNRVGGRVHTYRKGGFIADLGPNCLNGITGNPLMVLGKQLELSVTELKQRIPIFEKKVDKNGVSICHQVHPLLERAVEREYNKIMEGTRVLKNQYGIETYHTQAFPVGMAVDWVMKLQEKNVKDEQVKYLSSIQDLYQQLIGSANKKLEKSRTIKELHGQLSKIKDSSNQLGSHKDKATTDAFNTRFLARELDIALREFKLLLEKEEEIHNKISELTKSPPSDTYMTINDRCILDWHFAELEYALGCPINQLAIYYEDDEQIFPGNHWMVVHGFSTFVEALKTDLDIQLSTAVRKIIITKNGCRVTTYQPDNINSPYNEITADAVLCTLPLGTLKDSIIPSLEYSIKLTETGSEPVDLPRTQKGYQPVIFSPNLPNRKVKALDALGCGNLNKIIMYFDKAFWNHDLHLFGVVNPEAMSRGEFFLFWHYGRTPTLTGLISGLAADLVEKLPDVEILERCLGVLRSVYGNASVPAPKDYVVTRWRKDPWARGAWSFMKTGATGDDYDLISEPVILDPEEPNYQEKGLFHSSDEKNPESVFSRRITSNEEIPRLFFAGEHTSKFHFASAHGAVLTGLREAAQIANVYLGCPYDVEEERGIYMHLIH